MTRSIDFADLKQRVSFEQAIRFLGLQMTNKKQGEYRSGCPACNSGGPRVLVVLPHEKTDSGVPGVFFCHTQDPPHHGDVISFVAHIRDVSNYEAARMLEQAFPPVRHNSPAPPPRRGPARGIDSVHARLAFEHQDVQALGLTPEAAEALGVGYMANGTMTNRVLFPIRSDTGELLAYCGLAVSSDQEPRFKFPNNFEEEVENKVVRLARR